MPKRKGAADDPAAQSKRFLDAAKAAEVDESGRKFARAFKKVVKPKTRAKKTS